MSERFYTILSSAPTFDSVCEAVTDFYAGCAKAIRPSSCPGLWDVFNADGSPLIGVHIRKKRGRWLFVSTP